MPFNPHHFVYCDCTVSIHNLWDARSRTRSVSDDHVAKLVESFRTNGVSPAMRSIFAVVAAQRDNDLNAWLDKNNHVVCDLYIIDGIHRLQAFRKLKDEDPLIWDSFCDRIPVTVVVRQDGNHPTESDIETLTSLLS